MPPTEEGKQPVRNLPVPPKGRDLTIEQTALLSALSSNQALEKSVGSYIGPNSKIVKVVQLSEVCSLHESQELS